MPIVLTLPTLPLLVALTLASVAVVFRWLRLRGALTPLRAGVGVLVCVYVAGVLNHVLPFGLRHDPRPWRVWVNLEPFVDVLQDPTGIVLNVLLFVPLGLLLPLVARVDTFPRITLAGFLLSLAIELAQLLGDLTIAPGRIADVDDLIGNTLGALVGYAAFRLLTLDPAVRQLVVRAAWPSAVRPASRELTPSR